MGWLSGLLKLAERELSHIQHIERGLKQMADELKHLQDGLAALQTAADRSVANEARLIQLVTDLKAQLAANDPTQIEAVAQGVAAVNAKLDAKSAEAEGVS